MHLIQSLAGGVNGGANGTAVLLARGTGTPVTYYQDFEATQQVTSTLAGVPLDANGALVVYVNQLVDVRVLDVNGAILREFVAGDNATAVEVLSPSFTGVDYVTGASAANKPTTLDQILALVFGSFGTTNFNVLANGAAVTVQTAVAGFAGLFFNVKSFGALGDGVSDDGAAITSAIAAAAAAGVASADSSFGGIVFFPPGKYRTTLLLTVTGGVNLLGAGSHCTVVAWDNAAIAEGLVLAPGGQASSIGTVTGLKFDTVNTNFANPLVLHAGGGWSLQDCVCGGAATTKGVCLTTNVSSLLGGIGISATRCSFTNNADVAYVTSTGTARVSLRDCVFTLPAAARTAAVVSVAESLLMDGCVLDGSLVTGGTLNYVVIAPSVVGAGCVVKNSRFRSNNTITAVGITNTSAAPQYDCDESGNIFGDGGVVFTPYAYTVADGYAGASLVGWHGSRTSLSAFPQTTNANVTVPAKASSSYTILRTGAGAQVITVTEKGRMGDRFTLKIYNNSGGVVAPTFGGLLTIRPGYVANIANTGLRVIEFIWSLDLALSANGIWLQTATESGG